MSRPLPHPVKDILDVRGVQLQESRPDDLGRVIIPGHTDHLPVGADGIHHELHQLVQPVFIKLHVL